MSKNQIELFKIDNLQANEKSLMDMFVCYKDRMLKRASDDIRLLSQEKQEHFLAKLFASIVKNENLKECFTTAEGKYSIYKLIDDCLKTGLELDKHAYPVPYNRKIKRGQNEVWVKEASFQIRDRGFHVLLCGGSKPLFKDLRWAPVFEAEKTNVKIDRATGEVKHEAGIEADRGKIIGVWVQAIKLDGTKEAEFYPIKIIHEIRDNHSKTYQAYVRDLADFKAGKAKYEPAKPAWITDEIPMSVKTAIKAFCRPYADVKDELAEAYYAENEDVIMPQKIEDVASEIIDMGIENLKEPYIEDHEEPEVSEEPEVKKEEKPVTPEDKKQNKKDGIIF